MTREEIENISERLSSSNNPFELWASGHIKYAIKEWEDFATDFFSVEFEYVNEEIALNFDAKWLGECQDEEEMMSLLRSWYNKNKDNERFCSHRL